MEPFDELQNTIQQVLPLVLVGPGVILVGSGLFLWLGGLRWLKSIAAFTAALAGILCAWYFTERQLVPMVLLPVILAGLGIYFHKTVVVLLGAALAALLVLLVPVIVAGVNPEPARVQAPPAGEERLNLLESIDRVQAKIRDGKQAVKDTIAAIPASRKQLAAGVGIAVCVAGLLAWRLVCAAACSVIGTTLIASGMTVLLIYKGAEPVKTIMQRPQLAAMAAVGMMAVGVLIQLVLCPAKAKNVTKDDIMKDLFNEGDKK